MIAHRGYFRGRGTYSLEKTAPTRSLAKRDVDEYKLYLIRGKSRKHPLCVIDSAAQVNRKIACLQLLRNRRRRRFHRLNDECERLWHPAITLVIESWGE